MKIAIHFLIWFFVGLRSLLTVACTREVPVPSEAHVTSQGVSQGTGSSTFHSHEGGSSSQDTSSSSSSSSLHKSLVSMPSFHIGRTTRSTPEPYRFSQLMNMNVQDYPKINHETHLCNLDKDQVEEFAERLFRYARYLIWVRNEAWRNVLRERAIAGVFLTGSPQAHVYQKYFSATYGALLHLTAPLLAVKHASDKTGSMWAFHGVDNILRRISISNHPDIHRKYFGHVGGYIFRSTVGVPTVYIRKSPTPRPRQPPM